MRYTSPSENMDSSVKATLRRSDIPLLDLHFERLREAHQGFVERDGSQVWGDWPGDTLLWEALAKKLMKVERGDWRVRTTLTMIDTRR